MEISRTSFIIIRAAYLDLLLFCYIHMDFFFHIHHQYTYRNRESKIIFFSSITSQRVHLQDCGIFLLYRQPWKASPLLSLDFRGWEKPQKLLLALQWKKQKSFEYTENAAQRTIVRDKKHFLFLYVNRHCGWLQATFSTHITFLLTTLESRCQSGGW